MHYDYSNLMLGLPGLLIIGNAVRGMVRKNLTTYGRGQRSNFQGRAAIREGLFQIAFGLVFVMFSFLLLLKSTHA